MKTSRIINMQVSLVICAVVQSWCNTMWARPTTAFEAQQAVAGWLRIDQEPLDTIVGKQMC